jgi:group I intron endonuclease
MSDAMRDKNQRLHTREIVHVYRIYFPGSGKCYIGQTCDLKRRAESHIKADSIIGLALRKYDEWSISVLHTCYSRYESNRTEIEEIRNFDSVSPNGYNLSRGGEGSGTGGTFLGCRHTDESLAKMSESHKGVKAPWVSKALKGKKQTPEHIEKVRQAGVGRKHSDSTKQKMSESAFKRTRLPFSDKAKKNMGKHVRGSGNPSCRIDVQIKKLKNRMEKSRLKLSAEILDIIDNEDKLNSVD